MNNKIDMSRYIQFKYFPIGIKKDRNSGLEIALVTKNEKLRFEYGDGREPKFFGKTPEGTRQAWKEWENLDSVQYEPVPLVRHSLEH